MWRAGFKWAPAPTDVEPACSRSDQVELIEADPNFQIKPRRSAATETK